MSVPASDATRPSDTTSDRDRVTPLPWGQITVLWLIMTSEFLATLSVIPFAPFMVRSFGSVTDERHVGYWVGFITAAFSLAQVLSAYPWGILADRFGRKPIIILGLVFTSFFLLLFGVSTSLPQASLTRFLAGLFNGNLGVVKCTLGEITDRTNQAHAFAIFGLATSVGMVAGPMLGGLLASPADRFPRLFDYALFRQYPFLLPTLVVSGVVFVCAVLAALVLRESLPSVVQRSRALQRRARPADHEEEEEVQRMMGSTDEEDDDLEELDGEGVEGGDKMPAGKHAVEGGGLPREAKLAVACYGFVAFQYIVIDELFPLWSMQSAVGLGFDTAQVGRAFAIKGFGLLIGPVVFPLLERRYGSRRLLVVGSLISVIFFAIPDIALLRPSGPRAVWIAVAVSMICTSLVANVTFSAVMLQINNSVSLERLGELNGVGQSVASLARGVGPVVSSMAFSWSQEVARPFPLDVHLAFVLASIAGVATHLLSRQVL